MRVKHVLSRLTDFNNSRVGVVGGRERAGWALTNSNLRPKRKTLHGKKTLDDWQHVGTGKNGKLQIK